MANHAPAMEIILQGRADELFDDNINSSNNKPESDWVTNLMLGLEFKSEMRGLDFNLSGNVYQRYYIDHHENNANYQDVTLNLNKSITETSSFKITDVFQHYPDPESFSAMFGRTETTSGYLSNKFSTGLSAYVTKGLFFDVLYINSILKNKSDAMVDTVLHNPRGDIGYSFDSANILRAGYMYSLMKYEDGKQSKGNKEYAEYEKYFTKQFRTILHGGYEYITTSDGVSSGPRWMVSIIDDVDKNNQLNITYLKETAISDTTNDTFNNWSITGSLRQEISERTRINLSLFYGQGTYKISKVENKLAGVSTSIAFIVNEFVNFNIGYNHTWNNTKTPGLEVTAYHRNQASAGLSATY